MHPWVKLSSAFHIEFIDTQEQGCLRGEEAGADALYLLLRAL